MKESLPILPGTPDAAEPVLVDGKYISRDWLTHNYDKIADEADQLAESDDDSDAAFDAAIEELATAKAAYIVAYKAAVDIVATELAADIFKKM